MAKKDVFEKLHLYYNSITDIDRIKNEENIDCNNECRLDRVLFSIKDIPKKDLLPEDCNAIIDILRHSIVELYKETYNTIEQDIFDPDSTKENNDVNHMSSLFKNVATRNHYNIEQN